MVVVSRWLNHHQSQGVFARFRIACCALYVLLVSDQIFCNLSANSAQIHIDRQDHGIPIAGTIDYNNLQFSFPWIDNVRFALERFESESEVKPLSCVVEIPVIILVDRRGRCRV